CARYLLRKPREQTESVALAATLSSQVWCPTFFFHQSPGFRPCTAKAGCSYQFLSQLRDGGKVFRFLLRPDANRRMTSCSVPSQYFSEALFLSDSFSELLFNAGA